jgi:hypothetical protein
MIEELWAAAVELAAHDPCNQLRLEGPDGLGMWKAYVWLVCDCGTEGPIFEAWGGSETSATELVMAKWRYDNELRPEYFVYPQGGY